MYGNVVLGVEHHRFEDIDRRDRGQGRHCSTPSWSPPRLAAGGRRYKAKVEQAPARPSRRTREQLWGRHRRVFSNWMNPRHHLSPPSTSRGWGTAVNVQAMVFGNMGDDCATGVAFTRDPRPGERTLRRVPGERPGRGRRRRHPHAAAHHHRRRRGSRLPRWKR